MFTSQEIQLCVFLALPFILRFYCVRSECTADSATEFVAIDAADYDLNYTSITSVDKRPYGFAKATWYYNNPGQENPCVKVTGATNRRIEVMVETVPQSRLCVKKQDSPLTCADSGTGRLYSCKPAPANTVFFEFYCDQQCGEQNVQFWYRIILGLTPADDPEDHFCDNRSHEEYPEYLRQLPPGFDFPDVETTTPLSHASSIHQSVRFAPVVLSIAALVSSRL